ncbi:MAG: hypothetical protein GY790_09890 [Bacteroidetes bacterium]|nr:hypothetical protein [Bacteroidota bacterium]
MKRRNFIALSATALAGTLGASASAIPVNFLAGGSLEAGKAGDLNPNTRWLREASWGLFSHFLPLQEGGEGQKLMTGKKWNRKVNSFRVSELGDQLEAIHAPYFFITLGREADYFCSPSSSYEKLFGPGQGRLTERDLVADLAADLIPRGIKLCVYIPALGMAGSAEEQQKYQQVIREWSERWGKSISAWWVDDGKFPDPGMYKAYNNAFKAGNSDTLIAYNGGRIVMTYNLMKPPTGQEDYFAGQADWLLPVCQVRYFDKQKFWVGPDYHGDQLHFLTFLGSNWGVGEPRFPDDLVIGWTQHTNNYGGTVSFDVPLSDSGIIPENHFRQLESLHKNI